MIKSYSVISQLIILFTAWFLHRLLLKTRCSCEIPLVVSRIIKKYNLWNYIPAVKDISVLLICQERLQLVWISKGIWKKNRSQYFCVCWICNGWFKCCGYLYCFFCLFVFPPPAGLLQMGTTTLWKQQKTASLSRSSSNSFRKVRNIDEDLVD